MNPPASADGSTRLGARDVVGGLPERLTQAFRQGGETGAEMLTVDWAASPVGDPSSWPDPLCTALTMMLASRAQIILFWGSELTCFYNDAYLPIVGVKRGLGRPASELWSEIWDVLCPLLDHVLTTDEAFWAQDHPFYLERHGYREETYFDISYDPVRVDGRVRGIYCIVSETTGRVLGERRLRSLGELGTRLSAVTEPREQGRVTAQVLADNPNDVPFVLVYLDGAADGMELVGWAGVEPDAIRAPRSLGRPPAPGSAQQAAYQVLDTVVAEAVLGRGRAGDFVDGAPENCGPDVLVLPVRSGNENVGALVFGVSRCLPLTDDYRGYFDLVAGQLSTAVTTARAYAQERRRAASLAALDQAKTDFFSNVSHEFRTPLTLILRPLEDLLADASLPDGYADPLRLVHRNALRLLQLVNTLLDFAQIEAGRMRAVYAPTDLCAYTTALAGVFRSAIERAGLRLTIGCDPLPEVYVDRAMWEKVVLNLLANAVKFTLSGGIDVHIGQVDGRAVLRVTDTGVGIPADELPHLFERFHRVRNVRARSQEGTGIGLAMVQELVALHGGIVEVTSEVGAGSTFTVSLPLGTAHLPADQVVERPSDPDGTVAASLLAGAERWAAAVDPGPDGGPVGAAGRPAPVPARATGADAAGSRILLVDDNQDLRDHVTRLLAGHWQVVAVADGARALAALRSQHFDLVLTDVMMPRLDGFELVAKVRADPRLGDIPIIVLSARAGTQAAAQGLASGADDYLVKPFSAQELLARVRANLELSRLRRRLTEQVRVLADAAVALIGEQTPEGVARTAAECAQRMVGAARVVVSVAGHRHSVGVSGTDGTPAVTRLALTAARPLGDISVWPSGAAPLSEADRGLLGQLARVVALQVENMRLYEAEHRVATTLQHSLLPQALPQQPGAYGTYRYLPGSGEADVGGDWYDVIRQPDGQLILIIGDVVGKGVAAAASMGQLRNALRAYLLEGYGPAELLPRLNRLVTTLDSGRYATMACLRLDPAGGYLEVASAGHPAPLLIEPDGTPRFLHDRALGPPVGALPDPVFRTVTDRVAPGSRLVLYTDGLVEDRDSGTDAGMTVLLEEARRGHDDVDDLLDRLLRRVANRSRRDDIAMLGVEVYDPERLTVRLRDDPTRLSHLRRRVEGFLSGHQVPDGDIADLTIAVSEAAANAIEHPVERADPTVTVEVALDGDAVVASVRDQGHWRAAPSWGHRGRGLAIIRSLADLSVDSSPDGTTVTLRRPIGRTRRG